MAVAERILTASATLADAHYDEAESLAPEQLTECQLACAQRRFSTLRGQVGVLDRLAASSGVRSVDNVADLARLLLPHTVFKSYPLHWIDDGRFDLMTRWIQGLTSLDLSAIDCTGLETIDDWISYIDLHSELRVIHTFGTSGKLSFIPRSRSEWRTGGRLVGACLRDWHGRGSGRDLIRHHLPLICPSYRLGAGAIQRGVSSAVELFAGGDDNCLFLYPQTRFSADVASLAGRLRTADLRGDPDSVVLTPSLRARRAEAVARERTRERDTAEFLEQVMRRYMHEDIYLLSVWPVLYDWATAARKLGSRGAFGRGSILHTGGGTKGRQFPPGWRQQIFDFLGVDRHYEFYAMSELIAGAPCCSVGNYHIPPATLPILLDSRTGAVLPRTGRARGRFAAFDLLAECSWGGVISGDEVTLAGWDDTCQCGRRGTYVEPDIRRFSAAEGGVDKISCSAANDAYERAVGFLAGSAESIL